MQKVGVYIHIPFCKRACFYCHFFKQDYDAHLVEKYIRASVEEIRLRSNSDYLIDSIYIGGGSPSLLNERQVSALMHAVADNFKMETSIECTMEMNPEDVNKNKLGYLKAIGINRVSIGTQSFVRQDLNYLRRTHNAKVSIKAIENAMEMGFSNINVDFIISLPTQTRETLTANFSMLWNYDIPHVSAYLLEENEESEKRSLRDNDLYFFTRDLLFQLGYSQYEISNFSKPGFQSVHNMKYWENKSYIGVGLSASGYENRRDYKNTVDFNEYFRKIDQKELPQSEVSASALDLRGIIMGLRLLKGISIDFFNNFREQLDFLLSNGFLECSENRIAVPPGKLLLLNEILTYFMPD